MLKTYLQALLSRFYSKKESALVGQQAMASTDEIILDCPSDFTNWDSYASGTAPCDGYLQISGASTDERASVLLRSERLYSAVFSPFNGGGFEGNISIAKGQSYFVDGASMSNVKLSIVKTIGETIKKNVGGGNSILNPILQGGLLCLRNTCKLYLKPLSVVRKSGSVIREHQIHDTLIGVLLNLGRLESIQPRVMVKLCVELLEQQNVQLFKLKHHLIDCFFAQTVSKTLGIPAIQSPLKRVTRFTLLSDVKPLGVATSSLYQLSDRRSLGFGGALC